MLVQGLAPRRTVRTAEAIVATESGKPVSPPPEKRGGGRVPACAKKTSPPLPGCRRDGP